MANEFKKLLEKEIKIIAYKAMNDTAFAIRKDIQPYMKKVFDDPTSATLNSVYIKKFDISEMKVQIKIKDEAGKGNYPAQWLYSEVFGGIRAAKRSEKLLMQKGILNPGEIAIPAKGVLNKSGNITGGKMTQILSAVKAFEEVGSLMNETKASKKRSGSRGMFYSDKYVRGKRSRAIYKRLKKRIKPQLFITSAGSYKKRFNFFQFVVSYVNKNLENNFYKRLNG